MQEITFDELSTLKQPSASLRTALDKISAALGSVGDAGQQARSVVDELRVSLRAAAAQSVKSARSLAKFDEINRLSAPAEDKTAAPEKQKKAAEAAAKAEKAARSTTGTAAMAMVMIHLPKTVSKKAIVSSHGSVPRRIPRRGFIQFSIQFSLLQIQVLLQENNR